MDVQHLSGDPEEAQEAIGEARTELADAEQHQAAVEAAIGKVQAERTELAAQAAEAKVEAQAQRVGALIADEPSPKSVRARATAAAQAAARLQEIDSDLVALNDRLGRAQRRVARAREGVAGADVAYYRAREAEALREMVAVGEQTLPPLLELALERRQEHVEARPQSYHPGPSLQSVPGLSVRSSVDCDGRRTTVVTYTLVDESEARPRTAASKRGPVRVTASRPMSDDERAKAGMPPRVRRSPSRAW